MINIDMVSRSDGKLMGSIAESVWMIGKRMIEL